MEQHNTVFDTIKRAEEAGFIISKNCPDGWTYDEWYSLMGKKGYINVDTKSKVDAKGKIVNNRWKITGDKKSKVEKVVEFLENPGVPGKVVFSVLLPAYFNRKISCKWDKDGKLTDGIVINNGILVQGQLGKKTMNRITEELYISYGEQVAIDYINGANFLCNKWNTINGYSFGIKDCLNYKASEIEATIKSTYKEVEYISSMPLSVEEKEVMIREALDKATQIGQKIAKDGMYNGQDNAMAIATLSEAKGSFVNLSYISCFLGLQTVLGQRYAPELCNGKRILACFDFGDTSPRARGFIENNFYKGLDPIDLFFHAWSSRKGLVDTAVTTKTSGYSHRQFGKKMENAHIDTMGCIRDCDNSIIDFCYGEMGFDAGEIFWTKGIAFFIDLKDLVEVINYQYLYTNNLDENGVEKTEFGPRQFDFIEKHLLLLGENTEPVQAIKARIMYVIKKHLQGVVIIVDKWCVETFFDRLYDQHLIVLGLFLVTWLVSRQLVQLVLFQHKML